MFVVCRNILNDLASLPDEQRDHVDEILTSYHSQAHPASRSTLQQPRASGPWPLSSLPQATTLAPDDFWALSKDLPQDIKMFLQSDNFELPTWGSGTT